MRTRAGWEVRVGMLLMPADKRRRQVPSKVTRLVGEHISGEHVFLSCVERPFMRRTIALWYLSDRYIPVEGT